MPAQWLGWAPQPYQKLTGLEGAGQALGQVFQSLGQMKQDKLLEQDLKNLGVHNSALQSSGMPNVPPPTMRSRAMQQLMAQSQLQNLMLGTQPITPFQGAQLGIQQIGAEAELARAIKPTPLTESNVKAERLKTILDKPQPQRTPSEQLELDVAMGTRNTPMTDLERQQAEATLSKTLKETELMGKPPATSQTDKQLLEATIKEKQAQIKKIEAEILTMPATAQQEKAADLRKEFDALTKEYRTIRDSYGRVKAASSEPSAAGDLALIFNYMKMLDPTSVVRESEFANAAATGSLGQRWIAVGQKLLSGERLSDSMRNDFVDRAKKLYDSKVDIFKNTGERYTKLANKAGVDPQDVITQPYPFEKSSKVGRSSLSERVLTNEEIESMTIEEIDALLGVR